MESNQSKLWTALPGIVQNFNAAANTCSVQPAIKGNVRSPDGSQKSINMPLLLDCPVVWQGGGGCTLTFPVKAGDECLVVFASRCIDAWWQLGGVQEQAEFRMHDLSDGFALVGLRSVPRAFPVSTTAAQLRSDDGAALVEINPETKQISAQTTGNITATAGGDIDLTAPTIRLNGNVVVTGTITDNSKNIGSTHTHSGGTVGAGETGAPT